jgi:drug/metabolite transporter (DMT)-like permease
VLRGVAGFIAISGTYFSLQHLSLSDAMVLKFFVPFLTGISGAIFLKEPYTIKEILAGLCSFFGVILIARPQFLFGSPHSNQPMVDTPADRMISVTSEIYSSFCIFISCLSAVQRLSPSLLLPVPSHSSVQSGIEHTQSTVSLFSVLKVCCSRQ